MLSYMHTSILFQRHRYSWFLLSYSTWCIFLQHLTCFVFSHVVFFPNRVLIVWAPFPPSLPLPTGWVVLEMNGSIDQAGVRRNGHGRGCDGAYGMVHGFLEGGAWRRRLLLQTGRAHRFRMVWAFAARKESQHLCPPPFYLYTFACTRSTASLYWEVR